MGCVCRSRTGGGSAYFAARLESVVLLSSNLSGEIPFPLEAVKAASKPARQGLGKVEQAGKHDLGWLSRTPSQWGRPLGAIF